MLTAGFKGGKGKLLPCSIPTVPGQKFGPSNQSINPLASQSANQTAAPATNQMFSHSRVKPSSQSVKQSLYHELNQSINQSINQTVNKSINQSSANHSHFQENLAPEASVTSFEAPSELYAVPVRKKLQDAIKSAESPANRPPGSPGPGTSAPLTHFL